MSPFLLIQDALTLLRSFTKCPPTSQDYFKGLNTPTRCMEVQSESHRPSGSSSSSGCLHILQGGTCPVFAKLQEDSLSWSYRSLAVFHGLLHSPSPRPQCISSVDHHIRYLARLPAPTASTSSPSLTLAVMGIFLEDTADNALPSFFNEKTPTLPLKSKFKSSSSLQAFTHLSEQKSTAITPVYPFLTLDTFHRFISTCFSSQHEPLKNLENVQGILHVCRSSRGERLEEGGEPTSCASRAWPKSPMKQVCLLLTESCAMPGLEAGAKKSWRFQPSGQSSDQDPVRVRRLESKLRN